MLTGSIGNRLLDVCPGLLTLGDIPAIHRGIHLLAPEAKSVIEIGSQSARFLTALDCGTPPRFAVNEHCAGGTGSFFEDQMSRLGLRIEDYSELVAKARSIPRLSGRCAVFAKTDIIHRQQEGVPTPDILLGLCYAMVRNYKAVIVRGLSVEKPVALCGGVGYNAGVLRAIRDVFGLTEEELILPKNFLYAGAAGAALAAQEAGTCSMGELLASLCGQDSNTEGYSFFTMGGARSHDIEDGVLNPKAPDFEEQYWTLRRMGGRFRVNYQSWWKQELPSKTEYEEARHSLEGIHYEMDYVITHCAPTSIVDILGNGGYVHDHLTDFLEEVKERAKFHYWLFGHYHDNKIIDDRFVLLWEQMVQVV